MNRVVPDLIVAEVRDLVVRWRAARMEAALFHGVLMGIHSHLQKTKRYAAGVEVGRIWRDGDPATVARQKAETEKVWARHSAIGEAFHAALLEDPEAGLEIEGTE